MKSPEEYRRDAAFCAGLSAFLVVCGVICSVLAAVDVIIYTITLQQYREGYITVWTGISALVALLAACAVRGCHVYSTLLHHEALHKNQNP